MQQAVLWWSPANFFASAMWTDQAAVNAHADDINVADDVELAKKNSSGSNDEFGHGEKNKEPRPDLPSVLRSDGGENREMYAATRRAPNFSGWTLIRMSFCAIGVVYGDIGTSPLYVRESKHTRRCISAQYLAFPLKQPSHYLHSKVNGILPPDGPTPSPDDVMGVVSLIFWLLHEHSAKVLEEGCLGPTDHSTDKTDEWCRWSSLIIAHVLLCINRNNTVRRPDKF